MKCIVFTLETGDEYALPLAEVAKARAEYYAANDPDTTFQEEFDYVMNDYYEGIDWFRNNQDPEDFDGKFFLIKSGRPPSLFDQIREAETRVETLSGDSK